jgi:uncharacterized protein DUF4080/B12 binding protein/radical SAM family protein
MEFTIHERPADIAEKILLSDPSIVALSIYLWNLQLLQEVVETIALVRPEVTIILGGPEVSFVDSMPPIAKTADYIITGDGEVVLEQLCTALETNQKTESKFIDGGTARLSHVQLPYDLYTDADIANRVVYVEASRGCPFGCEFCLSCLDKKVRRFPQEEFCQAMERLLARGVRQFKFIDRALSLAITPRILELFLSHSQEGLFLHFELVPDHLPQPLFELIKRFPPGAIQLEAGIQTLNDRVASLIGRRQDATKALKTIERLNKETGAHVHADLVAGLPGESVESLALGFNRLLAAGPKEIQLGILKRLRGAPISRHTDEWQMRYNPHPPYEILQNRLIDFATMQGLKRFARYLDLVNNSGNFSSTAELIMNTDSPFHAFAQFSDWIFSKTGQTHAIALNRLAELLFEYLTRVRKIDEHLVANCLFADFAKVGRRSFPGHVETFVTKRIPQQTAISGESLPKRQARHSRSDG